jgi:hypothetical protein
LYNKFSYRNYLEQLGSLTTLAPVLGNIHTSMFSVYFPKKEKLYDFIKSLNVAVSHKKNYSLHAFSKFSFLLTKWLYANYLIFGYSFKRIFFKNKFFIFLKIFHKYGPTGFAAFKRLVFNSTKRYFNKYVSFREISYYFKAGKYNLKLVVFYNPSFGLISHKRACKLKIGGFYLFTLHLN